MKLRLYRGISVSKELAENIIKNIKEKGLTGDEGKMKFKIPCIINIRKRLDEIFDSDPLAMNKFFGDFNRLGICTCGDKEGALFYALKHNHSSQKTIPIIIELEVSLSDIYIDARDFLCPVFQFYDHKVPSKYIEQKQILKKIFGDKVLHYFDKCINTKNQDIRIKMCNLASFDEKIVLEHYQNKNVVRGRYGTTFCSAFFVQAPIPSNSIINCEKLSCTSPTTNMTIGNYIDINQII